MIEGILIGLSTALTFKIYFNGDDWLFFGTIIGMLPGLRSNDSNRFNDTNYIWF